MNKIFGIGMSKTGTTTLGRCFDILRLKPVCGYQENLKLLIASSSIDPISLKFDYDPFDLKVDQDAMVKVHETVRKYKSFHNSPWYVLFKQLDQEYPGSKFILTTRINADVQAVSDWNHNVKFGRCVGKPSQDFLENQKNIYESHNAAVKEYFEDRPNDLLIVCWEKGHGWKEVCEFLELPIPDQQFPHENMGK